jgi:hypothetical protein
MADCGWFRRTPDADILGVAPRPVSDQYAEIREKEFFSITDNLIE